MPRDCFVLMPFSSTDSCTEEEWTWIFENVIRPAVESAGLDYVCRRSSATRGNIIRSILQDISTAHVVLADLTDNNANVFYELGVRHTTKDRTILISQRRGDIPFDLQGYACHTYKWKTPKDIQALADTIREVLIEIENHPNRPDNPVSDFLKGGGFVEKTTPKAPSAPDPVQRNMGEPARDDVAGKSPPQTSPKATPAKSNGFVEAVYVNLPGPKEPKPGMSGGELLHGFLTDLREYGRGETKSLMERASKKWNIHYRNKNPQEKT